MPFPPFHFKKDYLKLLDQRQLPGKEKWLALRDSKSVYQSIQNMSVRGAPAIGVVAGYGLYLGVQKVRVKTRKEFLYKLKKEAKYLKASRPTAVNLQNIVDRIVDAVEKTKLDDVEKLKKYILKEAKLAHREDDQLCRSIGKHGSVLFKSGDRVLTHCNAGGLATSGYGTALGVLYAAKERGKKFSVYVDETRPLLQGARLTAWELTKSKIPCTLLCDNSAASLMAQGLVDRIIVGADRIAGNGDTANKIGTYNLAVLAFAHDIPFYVAAPSTTFDFRIASGEEIPIENRSSEEVTMGFGKRTAPKGMQAINFAFDVTPQQLVSAFITELGVHRPPFKKSFQKIKKKWNG